MIPFANQRANGQDLATHLLNEHDNEQVIVEQVRGAIARDLHGAFEEWELQADILTKCKKYLYSLSINPDPKQDPLTRDQYMDYISRVEDKLGLDKQPRAIVVHEKYGREHYHVVWSRIDAEKGKAVHIAYDRDKLMMLTRNFARDHGLELPGGYYTKEKGKQKSFHELEQERRTGLSLDDHKERVTDAWQQSDNASSFVQALAEEGYILAKGRRDYLIVDFYGGHYSLPKLINDQAVKIQNVRDFLGKEFPVESLPDLDDAKKLVAEHRKQIEQFSKDESFEDDMAELKSNQQYRAQKLAEEKEILGYRQNALQQEQQAKHRFERDQLRTAHLSEKMKVKLERHKYQPTGLAEFLGRISGINLIRKKLHHFQDAQRLKAYHEKQRELKDKQRQDAEVLSLRLSLQTKELERKIKALNKVEKRELQSLHKEHKRDQRIEHRGKHNEMPSLEKIAGLEKTSVDHRDRAPDLLSAFGEAQKDRSHETPDLMKAFTKASKDKDRGGKDSGDSEGRNKVLKPKIQNLRTRKRDKGNDRGR